MAYRALFVGGCPAPYHRIEGSAPPVRAALEAMGVEVEVSGIFHPEGTGAYTGDYSALTADSLAKFDLLILNTTGNERHGADIAAICDFVAQGKALIGIHCAADSFTDDPVFVAMLGGKFRTHPEQLDIATEIVDAAHPIMQGVEPFTVRDELYLFSDYNPDNVHLLAQTRSYDDNGPIPIAWTREPGQGRLFYLSLGHNPSAMTDSHWQRLFQNGVEWALRLR